MVPPPTTAGEPGFLWKKAGGKNTRAERGSLRPGPASLWLVAREGFSFFAKLACGPVSHARYGPPTGWAGWEAWFRRREGAILYPTFPCRSRKRGLPAVAPTEIFLLLRWASRSPPHPSPSVTASPQGEASGLCRPTRKKRPKSGHVGGLRNRQTIAPLRYPTPKRASGNERALTPGVQGACPRPSFSPFLGRNGDPAGQAGPRGAAPRGTEKAATTRRVRSTLPLPRPGPGGNPPRRTHPAPVQTRTTCRQQSPPPLSKLALSCLECQGLQFGHNIQKTSSQNGGILTA